MPSLANVVKSVPADGLCTTLRTNHKWWISCMQKNYKRLTEKFVSMIYVNSIWIGLHNSYQDFRFTFLSRAMWPFHSVQALCVCRVALTRKINPGVEPTENKHSFVLVISYFQWNVVYFSISFRVTLQKLVQLHDVIMQWSNNQAFWSNSQVTYHYRTLATVTILWIYCTHVVSKRERNVHFQIHFLTQTVYIFNHCPMKTNLWLQLMINQYWCW